MRCKFLRKWERRSNKRPSPDSDGDGQHRTVPQNDVWRMPVMCYNERMKRIAMYVTEQQHKLLKELSERTGLTMAELVRRAIDEFLARIKR